MDSTRPGQPVPADKRNSETGDIPPAAFHVALDERIARLEQGQARLQAGMDQLLAFAGEVKEAANDVADSGLLRRVVGLMGLGGKD
jgi:hypothetical protein